MSSRPLILAALLAASLPAQTIQLSRTGGTIGKTLTLRMEGTPNQAFFLLPSLNAGPIPLKVLDPRDPRSLEVGLDLLPFVLVGTLPPTPVSVPYPIPNDANLNGLALHYHAFLFPGTTYLAGNLSNPIRQTLGIGNTWVSRGTVLNEARGLVDGAVKLPDGRWLLPGGGSGNLLAGRGLASSELYDPNRQRFDKGPSLVNARALHRSVTLKDGRVLLVGGVDSLGSPLATCEIFDPKSNGFTATGSLRVPRAGHTATILPDGRVLAAGGTNSTTDLLSTILGAQNSTEIWNPQTGTWSNGPNLSRVRLAHAAIALADGRVLVAGGITVTIVIPGQTNTCEIFNPTNNSFAGTGAMPTALAAATLTALADGRILATGGAQLSGVTDVVPVASSATFAPSGGSWTAAPNMPIVRAGHTGVQLPDGRVLLIGGAQGSLLAPSTTNRCDFFDPASRAFAAAPTMGTTRAAPATLLLPEGQVFVAGGGGGPTSSALASGEMLFLP